LGEEERERRSGMIEIVWKTSSSVMSDIWLTSASGWEGELPSSVRVLQSMRIWIVKDKWWLDNIGELQNHGASWTAEIPLTNKLHQIWTVLLLSWIFTWIAKVPEDGLFPSLPIHFPMTYWRPDDNHFNFEGVNDQFLCQSSPSEISSPWTIQPFPQYVLLLPTGKSVDPPNFPNEIRSTLQEMGKIFDALKIVKSHTIYGIENFNHWRAIGIWYLRLRIEMVILKYIQAKVQAANSN
jgi:hypothetical protein